MSLPPPTEKQARVIWFALTTLAVALTVAIIGAVLWGVGLAVRALSPVLLPLAIAAIVAFILDPVVDWLEARGIPRWRGITLVFAGAVLLVLGLLGSVVPRAVVEARDLAGRLPAFVEQGRQRVETWINHPPAPLARLLPAGWLGTPSGTNAPPATNPVAAPGPDPGPAGTAAAGDAGAGLPATNLVSLLPPATPESPWWHKALDPRALQTAGGWLATVVPGVLSWLAGQAGKLASALGLLVGLALVPIYVFFFLLEKQGIAAHWTEYLPVSDSRFKTELVWLVSNINDALIVFFRGQVLVALCDGVLYALGFWLIGLPYALLLGVVASVLTIIPFLGAIVTCGAALLIAFVTFGDWQHPALVLGVFAVVQGIEGWVIQPKIIGDRVGIHPLTIIIALMVGTAVLGGILGAILAIPVTAVLRAVLLRYVWRRPAAGAGG